MLIFHKVLKSAFTLAIDKGQLVRNPVRLATPPSGKVDEARPFWTPVQVGQFLDFIGDRERVDRGGKAERMSLPTGLVDTYVDSGARRGEVLGLRWSELDLEAGTATIVRQLAADPRNKELSIRVPKRRRAKSVIGLHPDTVEALRRRRKEQLEERLAMGSGWPRSGVAVDLVFTWPDGSPIHPDSLTKIIARLSEQAGLPRLTTHGLRHSFATAALAARVPVEVVAARLGNTPRVVQETYQHVIDADDAATAQLVGDLYRSGTGSG